MSDGAANVAATVTGIVSTTLLIVAAVYAAVQIREAKRSRASQMLLVFGERLHGMEASQRRRRVYKLHPLDPATLTTEQEVDVSIVLNDLDLLAFLVKMRVLEFEIVANLYYGTVSRCWAVCQPYIVEQRARRGTRYAQNLELIHSMIQEYMARERPDEEARVFS